jgi:hypothetical protein
MPVQKRTEYRAYCPKCEWDGPARISKEHATLDMRRHDVDEKKRHSKTGVDAREKQFERRAMERD